MLFHNYTYIANLRVGHEDTSEIAGYHKLIKELEAKNKRLMYVLV